LAAIHYNENSDRVQKTTSSGEKVWEVRFPKFKKGGYSIIPVKTAPTYGMI